MVSALVFGLSGLGSSCDQGHCVVFLGKTHTHSHSASLHPGVLIGTSEFNAGGNLAIDWHLIQGGVEILLVSSCYGNRSDGALGSRANFTLPLQSCVTMQTKAEPKKLTANSY